MNSRHLSVLAFILLGAILLLANTFYTVTQYNQALVLQFGRPVALVKAPGLHYKIPFIQNVEFFDKRLLDFYAEPKEVIAADQKRLIVDAFIRYRITDALKFKQAVADERTMRSRLNAILESSLRQVIGGVPLSEVISEKRAGIMQQIRGLVNAQAAGAQLDDQGQLIPGARGAGFGIEVVDVRIMRADLPQANSEGIYRRMQTEREREAKEFRAKGAEDAQKIRSQAEKERTILVAEAARKAETLRGEGDQEALKIMAGAVNVDPQFYGFYRTLQAYRKALTQQDTTLVIAPGSEFLNVMEKGQ